MIKMLQFILSIPECVGWMLVGFLVGVLGYVSYRIILVIVEMVRDHKETEMEDEMEDED